MSLLTRALHAWKSLPLPWRRRRLAGTDLDGNTYWEHVSALGRRPRRIVAYKLSQADYADYKLTPQWHQWLRYTRRDAPSVRELQDDIVRLAALKRNAAIADERWAAAAAAAAGGGGGGGGGIAAGDPWGEAQRGGSGGGGGEVETWVPGGEKKV